MRVYKCDMCGEEISGAVYRINIAAFPATDQPETAKALDEVWANHIRRMDFCYECLTDTLRGEDGKEEANFDGGGYRPPTPASRFRIRSLNRLNQIAS